VVKNKTNVRREMKVKDLKKVVEKAARAFVVLIYQDNTDYKVSAIKKEETSLKSRESHNWSNWVVFFKKGPAIVVYIVDQGNTGFGKVKSIETDDSGYDFNFFGTDTVNVNPDKED
jgi:hypothetical protein